MAQCTVRIEVKVAWWVRWYLAGVAMCCKLTGLEPDFGKVLAVAGRGVTVPNWRPRPSLRRRIAAAYERSAWARVGTFATVLAVFWAGMIAILYLASLPMQPILFVAWLLLVATAATWVVVP